MTKEEFGIDEDRAFKIVKKITGIFKEEGLSGFQGKSMLEFMLALIEKFDEEEFEKMTRDN